MCPSAGAAPAQPESHVFGAAEGQDVSSARIFRQKSASASLPTAYPAPGQGAGKQKTAPKDRFNILILLRKSGAGEGIRTLDPNLGKVVLYP